MPLCPQITNTPITVTQTGDYTVTSVVPLIASTKDGLATDFDGLVVQLDGKTEAYYQATAPSGPNINEGDIWFDTDDGNKQYYYDGTAWVSVQDTAIAAAQSAANAAAAAATAAQTTADGKNKIYRQTTQPSTGPFAEGDLWFDTDDDNKIYRYTSGSWSTAVPLGNNALGNLSANKITSGTIDASVITVSNINAGNISTGTLNADRIASASITGTKIAAGTITASNIATGTITADRIATATITATQIAAGTITTDKLVAGNLIGYTISNGSTFSVSNTGVVTASSGTIGGFTLSATQIGDSTGTYMSTSGIVAANTTLIARAGSGSTGVSLQNGGNISMNGGSIFMAGGTVNFGTTGNISSANDGFFNGTVTASTVSATTVSCTTVNASGNITATNDVTANRDLFTPNHTTVTDAANGRVTITLGRVTRSTASSQRYKENIVALTDVSELDPKKLLQLPVRAFTYREDYLSESDSRFGALIPGFIAEEVDAVYPVAADYEDGNVESWNDRMIIPGLLALIQDLYHEIDLLKGVAGEQ